MYTKPFKILGIKRFAKFEDGYHYKFMFKWISLIGLDNIAVS